MAALVAVAQRLRLAWSTALLLPVLSEGTTRIARSMFEPSCSRQHSPLRIVELSFFMLPLGFYATLKMIPSLCKGAALRLQKEVYEGASSPPKRNVALSNKR